MTVSTEHQRAIRILYCGLMLEVRHRIDFIMRLYEDHYQLPKTPACELGYLQLRMICETIALACLAVQGELPGARTAKIRSAHEADYILKVLSGLNPNFYPQPGAPVPHPPTGGRAFIALADGFTTKAELLALYRECGDQLHRGNYADAKELPDPDFAPIHEAALRLIQLLKFHKISFLGTTDEMWVVLADPSTGHPHATLERPLRY